MNSAEPFQLQQVLLNRRDAIADSWCKAIARTSHVPHSASEMRQRLVELTEQAIALLLTEPFEHGQAQAIGAALVCLHYVEPETLGRTQEVLAQQLVGGLRAEQVVELQPRLAALLSGLTVGFFQQVRETILAEQEQIRSALTNELGRAQEALREAYYEVERQVQERTSELRATNESLQREIAERKRAEEALRESEERLRGILSSLHETMIAVFDREGNHISMWGTPELDKRYGIRSSEMVGKSLMDIFPPNQAKERIAGIQRIFETGEPLRVEYLVHLPGGDFWHDVSFSPVRGPSGEVSAVVGFVRDITAGKQAEEALRESEEKYRTLVDQSLQGLAVVQDFRIVFANTAFAEISGYTIEELLSLSPEGVRAIVYPEDQRLVWGRLRDRLVGKPVPPRYEYRGIQRDGTVRWLEIFASRIEYRGKPAIQGAIVDITERKRVEEVLRKAHHELERRVEERTTELAKANEALRAEIAERKRAEDAQQRYAVRLKQRAEELASLNQTSRVVTSLLDVRELLASIIGLAGQLLNSVYTSVVLVKEDGTLDISAENFQDIPPLEMRARPKGITRRIIATGEPLVFDEVVDDGTHNPSIVAVGVKSYAGMPLIARGYTLGVLLVHSTEPRAFSGQLPLLTTFANQVAIAIINAQLYEQVRAGRERLQALSHRLVEVQETERQRIARELHDEIGQALTGLKLALDMSMHLPADAVRTRLGEAQALVNELMVQVRELSLDLRPAMLDNLGLLPTLLWHFERYTSQTNVRVAFRHTGLEGRRFAPEVETAAYRIVQEALTNVARHAGVSEVTVRLWAKQDILGLQVEDQGIGFDPEAALATGATSGLAGMRERAILLGGRLTVEPATGTGTRLTAEFPLGDHLLERREVER